MDLPNRPLSAKQLEEKACDFQFNSKVPLKYWLRAAESVYTEVRCGALGEACAAVVPG